MDIYDTIDDTVKKQMQKTLKYHDRAIIDLWKAVGDSSETMLSFIERSKHHDANERLKFPKGRLYKTVEYMCNYYRGVGLLDHRQLRDDFSKISMSNDDHPDKLFEQMYALRTKYEFHKDVQPTLEQLVADITAAASSYYRKEFTLKVNACKIRGLTAWETLNEL